ncbi:GntR family transcriptional regulator [Hyunsoonleella sp. SJ7]|uniref:GntR family transcriptional regulator n=1 Tax=Hyunsoonleella aquatilis TaxID=2762758 RepID=A0A923KLJ9_9FLAO|nr:winged helix-turn-helix domain-containing protein [Hyunsoonleella aquatilis]MBC3759562.1 GntR family transcriptional regulator [Hyunsoonleella aquatilis]
MIKVKNKIGVPKYQQIVFSIEKAIIRGKLKKGDQIPSINSIREANGLSRDTVLMAFNELKTRGIIQSVVGKGYYVTSENIDVKQKVLLLFDELNAFKEDLHNAFINNLGEGIEVDIYFHHFNLHVFNKIIEDNNGNYNHYIIMPANLENTDAILKKLPDDKVYILDQMPEELKKYPGIYQNFKQDMFNNLNRAYEHIKKYQKLVLAFEPKKQPKGMLDGFIMFCEHKSLAYSVLDSLQNKTPEKGELYIIPDDKNLLRIIKRMRNNELVLAKDIGVISYNDALLKEIVEGGITTISTDFKAMGERLAKMISNNENFQIENPNHLILRQSL